MADERDRWLDKAAADRLLRGEPATPGAEHHARARAERLRAALDALAEPPPASAGELPGEAAALAAFRAARGTVPRTDAAAGAELFGSGETVVDLSPPGALRGGGSGFGHGSAVPSGSASHSGSAPRGRRPVRFALAAAVASVAVGGLAAAAGAGLLDRSTHENAGAAPAASVSVGASAASGAADGSEGAAPTLVPQPRSIPTGGPGSPGATPDPGNSPGAEGRTPAGPGASGGTGTGGSAATGPSANGSTPGRETKDRFLEGGEGGEDGADKDKESRPRLVAMCQDFRAGRLDNDRREKLVKLAKGLLRIPRYCQTIIDGTGGGASRTGAADSAGGSAPMGTLTPAKPVEGGQGVDGSLGLLVRR
ncbi:hypothetical protein ACFXDJ_22195 [Streptomyces sp. NPDC059443]|uniref:hypothetical protein n=1 Tax=unclassified Streptomyces TaxID=2593676 RepID=UPI003693EF1C